MPQIGNGIRSPTPFRQLLNKLKATSTGSIVIAAGLESERVRGDPGGVLLIEVDAGIQVPWELRACLFETTLRP
jgi:hypothetical protein